MIKLALDPDLVLTEVKTWRDAVMLDRPTRAHGRDGESHLLGPSMAGAAERVDGFMMLLQSCATDPKDGSELARLLEELREFRDWLQQGRYAADLFETLSDTAPQRLAFSGRRR